MLTTKQLLVHFCDDWFNKWSPCQMRHAGRLGRSCVPHTEEAVLNTSLSTLSLLRPPPLPTEPLWPLHFPLSLFWLLGPSTSCPPGMCWNILAFSTMIPKYPNVLEHSRMLSFTFVFRLKHLLPLMCSYHLERPLSLTSMHAMDLCFPVECISQIFWSSRAGFQSDVSVFKFSTVAVASILETDKKVDIS